ncbi:MAG: D-alanyl-D-alanine carboxypeptidase [Eubacteriales bacterium]|nr:D-alanyl-D-alanine carboxypeptidase [Eubacteriales bacterium]
MLRKGHRSTTPALICVAFFLACLPFWSQASGDYDPTRPENLAARNIRGEAAIVMEANTGQVLFEKNPDELRPPASTTKVLTALLALTMSDPEEIVTISAYAASLDKDQHSVIGLQAGEQLPMGALIRATMVASGNDGAIAIAEHISGSEPAFVALMNEAAYRYGCTRTHFVNAHGFHDDYHLTTARDLAIIAREATENDEFREIALLTSYTLPETNASKARRLSSQARNLINNSEDSQYYYEYATGIKTGFTNPAGYCFVGSASKQGVSLITVVLGTNSAGRWTDTRKLMEYGFSQYISTSVQEIYQQNPKIISISSYSLDDTDMGRLELDIRKMDPAADDSLVTLKSNADEQTRLYNERTQIDFTRTLDAPIGAGEVVGIMTYTPPGGQAEPVEYELIAARTVTRRTSLAPTVEEIYAYSDADPNPFPRFSLEFLLIVLIPVFAVILLSQIIYRLLTRKRKPRVKQKLTYKSRYYR